MISTTAPLQRLPQALLCSFIFVLLYLPNSCNSMTIENFRPVQGTTRIYRCAKTEPLAKMDVPAETLLAKQNVGLVVDLRSAAERDDVATAEWMRRLGFAFVNDDTIRDSSTSDDPPSLLESLDESSEQQLATTENARKRVLLIDVQPRQRVLNYLTENWLTRQQQALNIAWTAFDSEKQHRMRMDALNERGLPGLNEAILETGGNELCLALQEMTKHLETRESSVVFHCVQGKDRTGMLAMLCQSIMGMTEQEMIDEYAKSEVMRDASAAAGNIVTVKGRFDRGRFTGAPPHVMRETLDYVKSKYISMNPGYLDSIGFDKTWRDRFLQCQQQKIESRL